MALMNVINDYLKELGKQDVASCKQKIINETEAEIIPHFSQQLVADCSFLL